VSRVLIQLAGAEMSPQQILSNDADVQVSNAYISAVSPWRVNINWEARANSMTRVTGAFLWMRHCGDGYRDEDEQCDSGYGCYSNCTCPVGPQWAPVNPDATTINCHCQAGYVPSEGDCVVPTPSTPIAPMAGEPPISADIIVEPPVYIPPSGSPTNSVVPSSLIEAPPEFNYVLYVIVPVIAAVVAAGLIVFLVLFLRKRRKQRGRLLDKSKDVNKTQSEVSARNNRVSLWPRD